jgi:hypothetical protein
VEVDPLASMRCWAITLELGGRDYEIPALPAVDWWPVLTDANPAKILDFIPSTMSDPDDLDGRILAGEVTGKELGATLLEAVEEVTGRSFHVAVVLAIVAGQQWAAVGGQLAQAGFRWDRQPIGAALDAVYSIIVGGLKDEDREKFLKLLDNEQLTTGKRKTPDKAKVMAEFEAMAGPRPAPAPVSAPASGAPSGSAHPRTPRQPRPRRPAVPPSGPRKRPAPPGDSGPVASSGPR